MMRVLALTGLLTLAAVSVTTVLLAQSAWERVRSKPIDMTAVQQHIGIHAPPAIASFVKRDGIAFRAHAMLATLIQRSSGDPSAVGVQWVKAAAHARSKDELQQVVQGLRWGRDHSPDPASYQTTMCMYVEGGYWTGLQREAFSDVGLRCQRAPRRA